MAKIKMQNVRLSFPSLFQHGMMNGESTGKYEATFMLHKVDHADVIKEIKQGIKAIANERLEGKIPPASKLCLKDGDSEESNRPEYAGHYTLKASTKKRPMLLNRDRTPIVEEDNLLYPGCYVNGIVSLWAQDNKFGKRVNSQLDGVMFSEHGDPFGDPGITADEFDAFGGEEEADEFGF